MSRIDPSTPAGPAHPWRRVLRTILANLGAFVVTVPLIVSAMGISSDQYPKIAAILAGIVAVSAAITRILAIPQVEEWLQHSIRFLAAEDVAAPVVTDPPLTSPIVETPPPDAEHC